MPRPPKPPADVADGEIHHVAETIDEADVERRYVDGNEQPPEEGLVKGRWVDANPEGVWNDRQGVIRYGDPFWATEEQIATDPRIEAWDDAWKPDPMIEVGIRNFDEAQANSDRATGEEV